MNGPVSVRAYRGGYLIGIITVGVVAIRAIIFFLGQPRLNFVIFLLAGYALLYATEPIFQARFPGYGWLYFPLQTGLVLVFTNLQPFLDISSVLYMPLSLQATRIFPRRAAIAWLVLFSALMGGTLMRGLGWAPGLALGLLILAGGGFMISYDLLYAQTRTAQEKSQELLADLQQAHQKLAVYTAQADELATMRERNRLARELHDTVSQLIFSIRLNAQAAQSLLLKNPDRLPEQLDRLQGLTASALQQLRAFILHLHPQEKT